MIRATRDKAARTDADGNLFASELEYRRWCELLLLERAGKIRNLRRQVKYPLAINGKPVLIRSDRYPNGRAAVFTADYVYLDIDGNEDWPLAETVEDCKGFATEAARLRIAIVEALYNVRVKITGPGKYRTKKKRRLEDYLNA